MYDLIILGGGSAAFASAYEANKRRKKVALINDGLPIGGTCINVGCIPTKAMIERSKKAAVLNISREEKRELFKEDLRDTYRLVEKLRNKNYISVANSLENVDIVNGFGKLNGSEVIVKNETFCSGNILIATGGRPNIPSIDGLDDYIHHRSLFLDGKWKGGERIAIIGGGPQGVEFAWMFRNYGFSVCLIQRSERILKRLDSDVSNEMERLMEIGGISVIKNANIEKVLNESDKVLVINDKEIHVDSIFVAAGIRPNTENIGLETAGVVTENGFIKVNPYLETTSNGIYAAGDVTGIMPLETVAAKQGKVATHNMFSHQKKTIRYDSIPFAVFSTPPIGSCGLREDDCSEGKCASIAIGMDKIERAQANGDTRGFIKMVVKGRKVVGIHAIGNGAEEMANIAAYIIHAGMTLDDIRETTDVFPTLGEAIKKVAQAFDESSETPCCIE